MSIRIILVDDHVMLREGLRALLNSQPDMDVVGEAADGLEAVRLVDQIVPHVVVMDIAMPCMNGLEATRRIKKAHPDCRVLILTQYENREYVLSVLKAGADGYVLKRSAGAELARAIRSVWAGEPALDPSAARAVIDAFVTGAAPVDDKDDHGPLTDREREVLILVAEGYSNQQIACTLHISPKTVEVHRGNIMGKLQIHNRTDLVKYAIRKGLVQIE
jgi:two-component system, NarL family, response regulator NreC